MAVAALLNLSTPLLPQAALQRSTVTPSSESISRLVARLRSGLPIVATAIGQSNTADAAGCFGAVACGERAMKGVQSDVRPGYSWAGDFFRWLNRTWPHPQHALYNRAVGASNARFVTTCLASHLAPRTHLLLVDFNIGGWRLALQEHFARTAASLPRRPFVLFVGFVDWCPRYVVPQADIQARLMSGRKPGDWVNARIQIEKVHCQRSLDKADVATDDSIGDVTARVAAHYSFGFVSLFRALRPLLVGEWNGGTSHLKQLRKVTFDGIHGAYGYAPGYGKVEGEFSAYYRSVTELLIHFVSAAFSSSSSSSQRQPSTGLGAAAPPADDAAESALPTPLDGRVQPPSGMLSCYAWDTKIVGALPAPRVVHNSSRVPPGWNTNEFSTNGTKRRKPGLVSLVPGDTVELVLHAGGAAHQSACLGLSYLESYELMGTVVAECRPPCACAPKRIDALNAAARHSLFRTVELAATLTTAPECVVRLSNEGASAAGALSKFRVSGMYVRRRNTDGGCERAPPTLRLSELDRNTA